MRNLFIGYNQEEDFRILISSWEEAEAEVLAEEYRKDAGLLGEFVISEVSMSGKGLHIDERLDCDYIITGSDSDRLRIYCEDSIAELERLSSVDIFTQEEQLDFKSAANNLKKVLAFIKKHV